MHREKRHYIDVQGMCKTEAEGERGIREGGEEARGEDK